MRDLGEPLIDVLLPVFNGASTIEESILSVLAQSEKRIRVLVVDDGSTDGTDEILAAIAALDPRVVVIRKKNGGIVEALNLGLSHVTAPYVARQDADDISFADRFSIQMELLNREPGIVAVSGSCTHIDQAGHLTGSHYETWDPDLADYTSFPSREPYLLHPFLMVRRDAIRAIGGYRYVLHAEDTDMYWRLRSLGKLVNLEEPLGNMRVHDGSISNASVANGRIMSVMSQLAAISARRRDQGRPDLEFLRESLAVYKAAGSLEEMISIAGQQLDGEELRYLRAAASVDLLTLASDRAYELEVEDCRFIRAVYSTLPSSRFRGRSIVSWAYRTTLLRLLRTREFEKFKAILSLFTAGRSVVLRFI